jgi:Chromatin assembly factor 1 subunit A
MKFLAFHTDYRPPYRGTYSKQSNLINGRRPYEKDFKLFNYDFDSEGEWEEGEGEGLCYTAFFVGDPLYNMCNQSSPSHSAHPVPLTRASRLL